MPSLNIECPYCSPTETLLLATPTSGQSESAWSAAWKLAANAGYQLDCPCCGATVVLEDDGQPVSSGGGVISSNVSSPRIDSLTIGSGPRTGGTALYINGSALNIGNLVVKFAGKPVQAVTNRSATQARVVTPIGRYAFPGAKVLHKLLLSNRTGNITAQQPVQFSNGSQATVRFVESPLVMWIQFSTITAPITAFAGSVVTGPTGSGPVASVTLPAFIVGEGVTGLSSSARGTFVAPFCADAPSAAFANGELLKGDASGATALLGTPAYSGAVDVTVENEYGIRQTGGTLVGGFTYL
jgi:hypothetical protein